VNKIRWVLPAIILLAGATISWWSARTASAVEQHIRNEVIELIPLVHENPNIIEQVVINPVLCTPISTSLAAVSLEWTSNKNGFSVTVTTGDDPNYGDGSATHVALVGVGGRPVLGLRILCNGATDPMFIAGVWTP
jgi:hypothetical protein